MPLAGHPALPQHFRSGTTQQVLALVYRFCASAAGQAGRSLSIRASGALEQSV